MCWLLCVCMLWVKMFWVWWNWLWRVWWWLSRRRAFSRWFWKCLCCWWCWWRLVKLLDWKWILLWMLRCCCEMCCWWVISWFVLFRRSSRVLATICACREWNFLVLNWVWMVFWRLLRSNVVRLLRFLCWGRRWMVSRYWKSLRVCWRIFKLLSFKRISKRCRCSNKRCFCLLVVLRKIWLMVFYLMFLCNMWIGCCWRVGWWWICWWKLRITRIRMAACWRSFSTVITFRWVWVILLIWLIWVFMIRCWFSVLMVLLYKVVSWRVVMVLSLAASSVRFFWKLWCKAIRCRNTSWRWRNLVVIVISWCCCLMCLVCLWWCVVKWNWIWCCFSFFFFFANSNLRRSVLIFWTVVILFSVTLLRIKSFCVILRLMMRLFLWRLLMVLKILLMKWSLLLIKCWLKFFSSKRVVAMRVRYSIFFIEYFFLDVLLLYVVLVFVCVWCLWMCMKILLCVLLMMLLFEGVLLFLRVLWVWCGVCYLLMMWMCCFCGLCRVCWGMLDCWWVDFMLVLWFEGWVGMCIWGWMWKLVWYRWIILYTWSSLRSLRRWWMRNGK